MDDLPLAVPAVPDARLLGLGGTRHAIGVDILSDADIGDAGSFLPNQVDVWVEDGGVHWFAVLGPQVLKVEAVEVQALYQVSESLWLKGGNTGVTHLRVALKVPIADGFDELLRHLDDLLFPHSSILILNGGVSAF